MQNNQRKQNHELTSLVLFLEVLVFIPLSRTDLENACKGVRERNSGHLLDSLALSTVEGFADNSEILGVCVIDKDRYGWKIWKGLWGEFTFVSCVHLVKFV